MMQRPGKKFGPGPVVKSACRCCSSQWNGTTFPWLGDDAIVIQLSGYGGFREMPGPEDSLLQKA